MQMASGKPNKNANQAKGACFPASRLNITPSHIILAVSPDNQDLTTSNAIKISREVNPKGERIFGVLTKNDLMEKGTDVVDVYLVRSLEYTEELKVKTNEYMIFLGKEPFHYLMATELITNNNNLVPRHAVDTSALLEYGADKPRADIAGGSCHSHRLILLRRAAAATACLDLALHLL